MQQTTNYALKKIELTDSPPDIMVINPNWDTIDKELKDNVDALETHLADYVKHPGYGITTFSNPTYSVTIDPAPTQYIDGMGLSLRLNADQIAGNAAINVNGLGAKNILNSKGFSVTNLKKDAIYSFRYSSAKSALSYRVKGVVQQ